MDSEKIKKRHEQLTAQLSGGLVVVSSYDQVQLSNDMVAPFLQEANFLWLTGITLPGWKVIIDGIRQHVVLVRPSRSEAEVIFDGKTDEEALLETTGANEIIDETDFETRLRQLSRQHTIAYTPYRPHPHHFVMNPAPAELHSLLCRIFPKVVDCSDQLARLRAIKSPEEIAAIRRAVKLTIMAFTAVRAQLEEYRYEYEVEADMTRAFRRANAAHAYQPIIAGGSHAVTLHYVENSGRIMKNQALLIDVGARVDGYAADITRTYCLKPTKRQQQVHAAVENAHRRIIALLRPDLLIADYLRQVDEIMKDALGEVGLLKNRDDTETYRKYFPHAISHGLGIDVHDSLGAPRYFQPGMVLTVEPGIYIEEEHIGVRIEDDILITTDGHENLSRALSTSL